LHQSNKKEQQFEGSVYKELREKINK